MPIGNITPKTDTYERSSMLLGAEEYPSSVQNQLCKNSGYLMYRPMMLGGYSGAAVDINTTAMSHVGMGYLVAGVYDFLGVMRTNLNGTANIDVDGTTVAQFSGPSGGTTFEGTLAAYTHAGGPIAFTAYGTGANGSDRISGWTIYSRQYEE